MLKRTDYTAWVVIALLAILSHWFSTQERNVSLHTHIFNIYDTLHTYVLIKLQLNWLLYIAETQKKSKSKLYIIFILLISTTLFFVIKNWVYR